MFIPEQITAASIAAAENLSRGDVVLRTFIGMVFIMAMMWLAVIVTPKLGRLLGRFVRGSWLQEDEPKAGEEDTDTPNGGE